MRNITKSLILAMLALLVWHADAFAFKTINRVSSSVAHAQGTSSGVTVNGGNSNAVDGDIVIVCLTIAGGVTPSPTSGPPYVQIGSVLTHSTSNDTLSCFYKIFHTGDSVSTFTWTGSKDYTMSSVAYHNEDTTPIIVTGTGTAGTSTCGTGTDCTNTGLTPTTSTDMLVMVWAGRASGDGFNTPSTGTFADMLLGNPLTIGIADVLLASSGATGTQTTRPFSAPSMTYESMQFSIKPQADTTPTPTITPTPVQTPTATLTATPTITPTPRGPTGFSNGIAAPFTEGAICNVNDPTTGYQSSGRVIIPANCDTAKISLKGTAVLIDFATPSALATPGTRYVTVRETQVANILCKFTSFPYSCCDAPATTTSGSQTLPTASLTVVDTSAFPTSGTLVVNDNEVVNYTGKTSTQFTSASGGFGTIPSGAHVYVYNSGSCNNGLGTQGWWPITSVANTLCTAAENPWKCCTGSGIGNCPVGGFSPITEFLGTGNGSAIGALQIVPAIGAGNSEDIRFRWDPNVTTDFPSGKYIFQSREINQPYGMSCQGGGVNIGNHPGNAGPVSALLLPANQWTNLAGDNGGFVGGLTAGPGGVNAFGNFTANTFQVWNSSASTQEITFDCTCGINQNSMCPPPNPVKIGPNETVTWSSQMIFGANPANAFFSSQVCLAEPTAPMYLTWNAVFNCAIPSN